MLNWIKRVIRKWLGITDPDAFIGVDIGYKDFSALVLIKRLGGGNNAVVEIVNFPPGVPWSEIEAKVEELQYRYGVRKENVIRDRPSNYPMRFI